MLVLGSSRPLGRGAVQMPTLPSAAPAGSLFWLSATWAAFSGTHTSYAWHCSTGTPAAHAAHGLLTPISCCATVSSELTP